MRVLRRSLLAGAILAAVLGAQADAQTANQTTKRVRGVIDAVSADMLTVTTAGGSKTAIGITERTPVVLVSPATLAAIKPGSYVGTAAVPAAGGKLRALEVHVFSEAMRGVGEGHRPWEGENTTMTNATVGEVTGTDGRALHLTYKGGEQTVEVGPDTPVITMDRGTQALLVKGAHVSISATPGDGGALTARFVAVGKDGFEPPL